ncbi:MAG: ankyrin repeat domain-containing protein [Puniceicoccales bacterium]|nr:ankyrin repeat domain-containing protein [Puniceicoccales bacterium]
MVGIFLAIFFACAGAIHLAALQQLDLPPNLPEILKIFECDQRTQNAWNRFIYIVKKFPCKRGDDEYRLLEALFREHPVLLRAVDDRGQSLLAWAILFRRADVVALLLFVGCAFETRDVQGNTPLLLAIKEKFTEAVVLLLAYGADPSARNGDGFNAHQLACATDRTIGAILLKRYPYPKKPPDNTTKLLDSGREISMMEGK